MSCMFQVSAIQTTWGPAPDPYQIVPGTRIRGSQSLQLVRPRQGLNRRAPKARRQALGKASVGLLGSATRTHVGLLVRHLRDVLRAVRGAT